MEKLNKDNFGQWMNKYLKESNYRIKYRNSLGDLFKQFFDTDDTVLINLYLKNKKVNCKCGRKLIKINNRKIGCPECDLYKDDPFCEHCGLPITSLKHAQEHSIKIHKVSYTKHYLAQNIKMFCTCCHEQLSVKIRKTKHIIYSCKNKNCSWNMYNTRKKSFNETISKRDKNSVSLNYSNGAYKREKYFKTTIEENGKSKKENIINKAKKKQSITMKKKIASGEFTPCVTNSWARSRCYIDNIPFRSSWEAMFYLVTKLPFEKIRIPYIGLDNKKHSYIIDFHDKENNVLYEIKPKGLKNDELVKIKEESAKLWCKHHNYEFIFIDEDWLYKNKKVIETNLHRVNNKRTLKLILRNLKQIKGKINENKKNNTNRI